MVLYVNHEYASQSKLWGMNSTYKYYGTALVIFEFHSFDLQASVHFIS